MIYICDRGTLGGYRAYMPFCHKTQIFMWFCMILILDNGVQSLTKQSMDYLLNTDVSIWWKP